MIVPEVTLPDSYIGDAATTQFPYHFAIVDEDHIEVLLDGTVKVLTSDYSVSGVDAEGGGNVTMAAAPAAGVVVTLRRKQPFEQTSVYQNNEEFPAKRLEKDINKLTMMLQQLKEQSQRSLAFPNESLLTGPVLPEGEAGKLLRWLNSTTLENVDDETFIPGAVTLPLSIANGGTASATAATARTALGVAGLADGNTFTARQHWQKGADIASAGALAPGTDGNYFNVTGTTTITSIGSAVAGSLLVLKFASALTVTHHATNLILREAINMAAAAGDVLILVSEGTGKWREIARSQSPASGLLLGHLGGLAIANNATDPTNDIDFAVGEAISDDAVITNRVLLNAGAMTKQLDAVWAAGTAAGGRAVADNLTGAKTFHVWIFRRTGGTDDYFFSTSLAPTVPDSGTKKRRIGSILWDGSAIRGFTQYGDEFILKAPVLDVDATNPGTAAVSATLTVPTGLILLAKGNLLLRNGTSTVLNVYISALASTDLAPSQTISPLGTAGSSVSATIDHYARWRALTNTSAAVRYRLGASGAADIIRMVTTGWIDTRGRG